jgi:hypothetical protein
VNAAPHAELLAIVALAAKTNQLATALQVPVDAAFEAGAARRPDLATNQEPKR